MLFIVLAPFQTKAYASNLIYKAEALVYSAPEKALTVTEGYLLRKKTAKKPFFLSKSNEVAFFKSASIDKIKAYLIQAQAYTALYKQKEAWDALDKAKALVEKYDLNTYSLHLKFTQAILFNYLNKAPKQATKELESLIAQIPIQFPVRTKNIKKLAFESALLNAIIHSQYSDEETTLLQFEQARKWMEESGKMKYKISYLVALGNYSLKIKSYGPALSNLLSAYWLSSEKHYPTLIALSNISLTRLYKEQGNLDKALQHANQAAEYYERFDLKRGFSQAQVLIAQIYTQLKNYNFALVHYFNALEIEKQEHRAYKTAQINADIARVYLKMERYNTSQIYIKKSMQIIELNKLYEMIPQLELLKGKWAFLNNENDTAIQLLTPLIQEKNNETSHVRKALSLLILAYEKKGDLTQQVTLMNQLNQLKDEEERQNKKIQKKDFTFQNKNIESNLKSRYSRAKQIENNKTLFEQKKINFILSAVICILLLILFLRHRTEIIRQSELKILQLNMNTHPRSGLTNLRLIRDQLSTSQAKIYASFERSFDDDMIHTPLKDKLNFAMFEVSFFNQLYDKYTYQEGLKLEREFGDFLKLNLHEQARIYHFSDTLFVYTEPHNLNQNAPETLAKKMQNLVEQFIRSHKIDAKSPPLNIGMLNYPFLPRAFRYIDNRTLIDILLMATNAAKQESKKTNTSQWIHLSAIDATPTAYFANLPLRQACLDCINSGLIKVQSSSPSGINWQTPQVMDEKQPMPKVIEDARMHQENEAPEYRSVI